MKLTNAGLADLELDKPNEPLRAACKLQHGICKDATSLQAMVHTYLLMVVKVLPQLSYATKGLFLRLQ